MKKLASFLIITALLIPMLAFGEAEWTFPLALKDINIGVLDIASHAAPLPADYSFEDGITVKTRKNDIDGNNTNGGIYMASNGNKLVMRRVAGNALVKMFNAAELDDITLYARAAYRSASEQKKRYQRAESTGDLIYMQPAGECDYETGLAVTVVNKDYRGATLDATFAYTNEALWLEQNAHRFGFVLRYPAGKEPVTGCTYEPWHLRYVGPGVASYMYRHNLSLEEFMTGFNAALDAYIADGGSMEAALAMGVLPAGPVELEETDTNGDHEVTLFHD